MGTSFSARTNCGPLPARNLERRTKALSHLSDDWQAGPELPDHVICELADLRTAGLVERQFRDMAPPVTTSDGRSIKTRIGACWFFRLTPEGLIARLQGEAA